MNADSRRRETNQYSAKRAAGACAGPGRCLLTVHKTSLLIQSLVPRSQRLVILSGVLCREGPVQLAGSAQVLRFAQDDKLFEKRPNVSTNGILPEKTRSGRVLEFDLRSPRPSLLP